MKSTWTLGVGCWMLGVLLFAFGCSTAPVQKPTQTIAPASAESAALKDLQAQTVSLAQQNTAIINAIQKSAQDTDQFRTEVKGSLGALTQNQFRSESWLAEVSDGWRMRVLGISPAPAPLEAGPQLVDGHPGLDHGAVPDARGAGAGADAKVPVLKKWRPTMWTLIVVALVAFILGAVSLDIFDALDAKMAQVLATRTNSVLLVIVNLWHELFGLIFHGKKKAPAAQPSAK